jgi:glutaredoxin
MTRLRVQSVCSVWCVCTLLAAAALFPGEAWPDKVSHGGKSRKTIGVVFFSSSGCEHCESVKELLANLKRKHRLLIKTFNVDQHVDYKLFSRLEAIHGQEAFAVPLVMLGDTILIGEKQIFSRLEKAVRKLELSGGSPLPYLGRDTEKRKESRSRNYEPIGSEKKADPPSVKETLGKLRSLLNRYFAVIPPL